MLNDVVNKLTFEFNCKSESAAKVVSHGIAEFLTHRFSEILSGLIARNTDDKMLWKIDRLEIDLGDIQFENFSSQDTYSVFTKRLAETFESARSRAAKSDFPADHIYLQVLTSLLLTGDLPWWIDKKTFGHPDYTLQSAMDNNPEELKHFLLLHKDHPEIYKRIKILFSPGLVSALDKLITGGGTGDAVALPGNQKEIHWNKLRISVFTRIVAALSAPRNNRDLKHLIIQNLLENQKASLIGGIRQLKVFSEKQLDELGSDLQHENQFSKVEKRLQALPVYQLEFLRHPERSKSQAGQRLKQVLKRYQNLKQVRVEIIVNHPGFLENNILGLLFSQVSSSANEGTELSDQQLDFLAFIQKIRKTNYHLTNILRKLNKRQSAHIMDVTVLREFPARASKKTVEQVLNKLPRKDLQLIIQLLGMGKEELETIAEPNPEDESHKTIIENAGLCILAPFLPAFFDTLGFTENGTFKSAHKAHRAVYMLQYLANGKQKNYEYLLQLNKLLCGIEMNQPITRYKRLTFTEKIEAEDLISSVINHWKAIKSTSIKGLQSSFLQRKGILTEKEDRWTLQVEKTAYDLLLDSLPWNYHFIKFQWMKKSIQVEW